MEYLKDIFNIEKALNKFVNNIFFLPSFILSNLTLFNKTLISAALVWCKLSSLNAYLDKILFFIDETEFFITLFKHHYQTFTNYLC